MGGLKGEAPQLTCFHINDDVKKCRYLSVTNNLTFSHNSFKFLPHKVLKEVFFAMNALMKIICFSNKCKFSEFKPSVNC